MERRAPISRETKRASSNFDPKGGRAPVVSYNFFFFLHFLFLTFGSDFVVPGLRALNSRLHNLDMA